jgi:putative ABC transport system permease protein
VEANIERVLRQHHGISEGQPDDFTVRLPDLIAEQSRGVSRSVIFLLLGMAALCALVAAAAIGLVYAQALRARRAEIGVRRATGATPRDILWQVWAEGLLVSLGGGAGGIALGWVIANRLAAWRNLSFGFDFTALAVPVALILLSSLAGIIPARLAAKLAPADALRTTA